MRWHNHVLYCSISACGSSITYFPVLSPHAVARSRTFLCYLRVRKHNRVLFCAIFKCGSTVSSVIVLPHLSCYHLFVYSYFFSSVYPFYEAKNCKSRKNGLKTSHEQQEELVENCSWTWTAQNGVNGILVTGPNGGTVFLPAAGGRWLVDLDDGGNAACPQTCAPVGVTSSQLRLQRGHPSSLRCPQCYDVRRLQRRRWRQRC